MPKLSKPTSAPWLVSTARRNALLRHPTMQFNFQKRQADVHEVTHVKNESSGGWIDIAAALGGALFPELLPLIIPGAAIAKHFLKGSGKHEKHEKRDANHKGVVARNPVEEMLRSASGPSVQKVPSTSVVQANLVAAMRQNPRPLQSASNPVRFAQMPTRLEVGDVPVLHGQSGHMPMLPITVQRTESHATMAGSEYLGNLQLNAAQTGIGQNVYSLAMNPRSFAGTKLTNEANTWQMFRFRRFVIEYIPIQGSSVTGSFVGYFTNDPFEPDIGGVQAVRNAVEHTNSLMWQPFFHSMFAYTDAEDKHLYFCQNVDDADARFEIQAVFKTVQNVSNTTGVPFGSFIMHYEVDFYYPETVQIESAAVTYPTDFQWDTPAQNARAKALWGLPQLPSTAQVGDIYQAIVTSLAANATNSGFNGTTTSLTTGLTVYFRQTQNGPVPDFNIYATLASADNGTDFGALYWNNTGAVPIDASTNGMVVLGKVSATNLLLVRAASGGSGGDLGLKTLHQDETQGGKFPAFTITNYMPSTQLPDLSDKALLAETRSRAVVVNSAPPARR